MTSFFEKLTGASDEEEEIETPKKTKKNNRNTKEKNTAIEKDYVETLKTKAKARAKKEKKKEPEEKSSPVKTKEEKDWLEEAEGEEGQLTIDVYQTDSDIVIKSTIAGVNPEDIDISITNDMVTIRGRRTKDEKIELENYYYQELYWGAFSRSVILPVEVNADKTKAAIKNGILTIRLPKSEKIKTKKIKINAIE
jgi:HSP20 family protein